MESPNLSIVVPVYNVAPYLRACLDSIFESISRVEHGERVEVICVDDYSTDGSAKILDEYSANRNSSFIVHHFSENRGVSVARNKGLELAHGEWVTFVDPDDMVEPDWLARLLEGPQDVDAKLYGYAENGKEFVSKDCGAVLRGDEVRRRFWRAFFGYRLRDVVKGAMFGKMWSRAGREMAGVWRLVIKREALGGVRFDERLRLYEDAIYLAEIGRKARSAAILGDAGYRWQVRESGAMTRERAERLVGHKFAARDARRRIDPKMKAWRGTFLLSAMEVLWASGSTRRMMEFLLFK